MAERQNYDPRRGERRPTAPASRGSGERRQTPSRRNDVIRCENCGEDYSITYKRCPFCDERPVRGGIAGKRVANTRGGGYGRPASTLRTAWWIVSFAVILCAAAIVVRFMGAPIFSSRNPPSDTSSSQNGGVSTSIGDASSGPDISIPDVSTGDDPVPMVPGVEAVVLNTLDVTLDSGKTFQLVANLLPAGVTGEVAWSSSDPAAASVDANGVVTNVNAGTAQARATITATCGEFTAQCTVYCNPKPAAGSSGTYTPGTTMKGIVTADGGLSIRSGPGTNYERIASAATGSEVTILGEENGWYHVRYSGSSTGYVSKEFVSIN